MKTDSIKIEIIKTNPTVTESKLLYIYFLYILILYFFIHKETIEKYFFSFLMNALK